ncbi:MAG: tRNA pseudouridine(55) synthase TruB [Anaerolineae bacterium]
MYGVLIVDKPAGMTSHDVVNRVRRLARLRRVGHAGTLDPMATGVLTLLLGPATRLSRFAMAGRKRYQGVVRLGQTTTTYDAEGEILQTEHVDIDFEAIQAAVRKFEGPILQTPPMYSAIKVDGQKLYELARKGREIEREPREVTIHHIEILKWAPPDLTLDVVCSSGTYIRSLAHDLGQELGCGAHLHALRRLASGPFTLKEAHSLEELARLQEKGRLDSALLPPHTALGSMPAVHVKADQEQAIRYGQQITLNAAPESDLIQARDPEGHLIAVLRRLDQETYQPTLVLPPADS